MVSSEDKSDVWAQMGNVKKFWQQPCFRSYVSSCARAITTSHKAAAPVVRAVVKIDRNDTIIAFSLAANKNKDSAKVALASSNS